MKQAKKKTKKTNVAGTEKKKKSGQQEQNTKEKNLRVLILEDVPADAELMEWQLEKAGIGFVSRLAVPGKWEPEDLSVYLLIFRGTPDPEDEMIRLFIERIKEALEVPILDEWASTLWRQARNHEVVQDLVTVGDCILGAKIDLQADWQGLLTELLAQEDI